MPHSATLTMPLSGQAPFSCLARLRRVASASGLFLSAVTCALLFSACFAVAAPTLSQLQKNLTREQSKAAERKKSLQRMTDQERQLNAGLAAAENRILELEKGIELHQAKLSELSQTDDKARAEYEALLEQQARTEKAQTETLRLLWDITCKRATVGGRDMADWAETDREYTWSRELFTVLEDHRKQLDAQETKLTQVLGRREKISRDMQSRLRAVDEEKGRLLQSRIDYGARLAELRKKRDTTEEELTETLKLIDSLNFQIAEQSGNSIEEMKNKLPWPVKGKVQQRYAPQGAPASRGIGIATGEGEEVRAIAGGKVVHNNVLRGFGTVLIVQHGDDYYSLYAFLGSSILKVGENVASRQRIGTTGYYPAIKGPGLYFELRFKQKAINPEQWLAPS